MYEFSIMMPVETKLIDKIRELNEVLKQSQITTFYFELPINCEDNTGFEQNFYNYETNTNFDFWKELILYAKQRGFDVVYRLNNPASFVQDSNILPQQLKKLDSLITKLKEVGIAKFIVANTQLIGYLSKYYPSIQIQASSVNQYDNIKQIINLTDLFYTVKSVSLSPDSNKNFALLKNLKKNNINFELTVNDGCIKGCPLRFNHNSCAIMPNATMKKAHSASNEFSRNYFLATCKEYFKTDYLEEIFKSNVIYPWDLKEYEKIGVNKFFLAPEYSKKHFTEDYVEDIEFYTEYIRGIEDYKSIENTNVRYFNNYISSVYNFYYTVGDIKKFLPNIRHFVKNGHLCSSKCGTECHYCSDCLKKFKKEFEII